MSTRNLSTLAPSSPGIAQTAPPKVITSASAHTCQVGVAEVGDCGVVVVVSRLESGKEPKC